jgi:hypothetical protein
MVDETQERQEEGGNINVRGWTGDFPSLWSDDDDDNNSIYLIMLIKDNNRNILFVLLSEEFNNVLFWQIVQDLFTITESPSTEQEDVVFVVYCSLIVSHLSGCHFRLHSFVKLFIQCNDLVEYSTCLTIFMHSLYETYKIGVQW